MDILSWVGSFILILSYFMLSTGRIKPENPIYHTMNLSGSVAFIIYGCSICAYPSIFINTVFAVIALYSIIKIAFRRK